MPGNSIEAVLDAGRRVVLQCATSVASPNLATIGRVDHRPLFDRSAVIVHHGGSGTTHTAAVAGRPQVVVPHVGDQRYWADRLHRLGVASPTVTLKGIAAADVAEPALTVAADPAIRDAARALASRVGAEDGIGATIALVERAAA